MDDTQTKRPALQGESAEAAPRLLPSERLLRIRQLLEARGLMRVSELAQHFEVSEMTIRRDLAELEKSGAIEKTFGAAVLSEQAAFESSLKERLHSHQAEKQAIARLAASLVHDGDSIAIDASTTGIALARELRQRPINVVTNGFDVAQALRGGQASVLLVGGMLREHSASLVGPLAMQAVGQLRLDRAFFSSKGLLLDGFVDSDLAEVDVKRAMLCSAAQSIALLDSSKFGKRALGVITTLEAVDLLISDIGLAAAARRQLEPLLCVRYAVPEPAADSGREA